MENLRQVSDSEFSLGRLLALTQGTSASHRSTSNNYFRDLTGNILEIGPGTGANLRYLNPAKVSWIGVEPNPFMQTYLHEEANRLGVPIEIRMPTGEALPVADESVDAVISTLVLCCVNSQQRALQEVLRVLKQGERLLFMSTWQRRGAVGCGVCKTC
jgi:ubiquinone/menaquinone biosynthesis C-methylase UbiE